MTANLQHSSISLSPSEIDRLVNQYIGVSGGYLGDFNYHTHAEFYPVYCNLDINPYEYDGTTRQRFITILSSLEPKDQAKVIRGTIDRFPVGHGPTTRTAEARDKLLRIIQRLESSSSVPSEVPSITSEVVLLAINDADNLLRSSGATSGVDRIHTALHGYLIVACDSAGITYVNDATTTTLIKALRSYHPKLADLGPHTDNIKKVLNACASIIDTMNPLRNRASLAHPNSELLEQDEAMLIINVGRTLISYLDSKLS